MGISCEMTKAKESPSQTKLNCQVSDTDWDASCFPALLQGEESGTAVACMPSQLSVPLPGLRACVCRLDVVV